MDKKKIKEIVIRLIKAHNSPREVALGVAIGSFIAILPLYGFHTLLVIIAAVLVRNANKLAMLLGTNVSLPPTIATITWTAYDIGRFVLFNKDYPPLSWSYIRHFKMAMIREFYYPLFVGSLILGLLCAVFFYYITLFLTDRIQKRHSHAS